LTARKQRALVRVAIGDLSALPRAAERQTVAFQAEPVAVSLSAAAGLRASPVRGPLLPRGDERSCAGRNRM